ncbi:MAG: hypothetical protein ACOVSR_16520 [Bacteroidia bacterium]
MELKIGFVLLFGISFIAKIVLHYLVDKIENDEKPSINNLLFENFVTSLKLKLLLPFYFKPDKKENKEISNYRIILRICIFMIYFSLVIGFFYSQ